jgi:hypothetical protein
MPITTIIRSIGPNRDHPTIADWESATDYVLVNADPNLGFIEIGELYNDVENGGVFDLISTQSFGGLLGATDATRHRILRTAAGSGTNGPNRFNPLTGQGVTIRGTGSGAILNVIERYLYLEGFRVVGAGSHPDFLVIDANGGVSHGTYLESLWFEGGGATNCVRALGATNTIPTRIYNCVAVGGFAAGFGAEHGFTLGGSLCYISNCHAFGFWKTTNSRGFNINGGPELKILRNNHSFCNRNADFGTVGFPGVHADSSHNVSSDATAATYSPGGSALTGALINSYFVDWSVNDFRLVNNAPSINTGLDLSAFFTKDFNGDTRPTGAGTWERGIYNGFLASTAGQATGCGVIPAPPPPPPPPPPPTGVGITPSAFEPLWGCPSESFDPRAISYTNPRLSCLQTRLDYYGVGHKLYDTAGSRWGTIYSHPLLSLSHELGREEKAFSFANYRDEIFVAHGGRVGIVENGRYRVAGVERPLSLPKVQVIRDPLWQKNVFDTSTGFATPFVDNDPIFRVNADPIANATETAGVTFKDPAVPRQVFHYNNPGTGFLLQSVETSMAWTTDKYFAFKCYIRMRRVSGRISLWSRRASPDSGGPFLEIRDGYVYAGWYDVHLKAEQWVRTSKAVIEPGKTYYIYYRKFFPRGGMYGATNALYTPSNSNWTNSIHTSDPANTVREMCYDSLIVREFPRADQAAYADFSGYDAKGFDNSLTGGANYDYTGNRSSTRACISFTLADSKYAANPYAVNLSGSGVVLHNATVDVAAVVADQIQIVSTSPHRFVLDHVGMLLQVHGATFDRQVYRIVELIDARTVRVVNPAGTSPSFTVGGLTGATFSVFTGVSLVKSESYDSSTTPDPADYPIEAFGTVLSANALNGFAPFDGEAWSFAWGVFVSGAAGTEVDGGGNKVRRPNIFEQCTTALGTAPERISCACEVGTDNFGLQGSTNPVDGKLPYKGVPAGELEVDNTFAHSAIDTATYYPINFGVGATVPSTTKPDSTQPNATKIVALDPSSTATAAPSWLQNNKVIPGKRLAKLTFFDRENTVESPTSDLLVVNVPEEDSNTPSAGVRLLFTELPVPTDEKLLSIRFYLTAAGGTELFLRMQLDNTEADSASVPIDELASVELEALLEDSLGVPPRASRLCVSQDRLILADLEHQSDAVAFSLPFFPEAVPAKNVFPVNTGEAGIVGVRDNDGELVVFKRTALLFYSFDAATGLPVNPKTVNGDGAISDASIVGLEDRIYWVADRGPMALLLGTRQPFFIGRRLSNYFRSGLERRELVAVTAAINRRRSQFVFTSRALGQTATDARHSIEFAHPSRGEDFTRTEMEAGHRFSHYRTPAITALGAVESGDGGLSLLVGGTREGFLVWLDRSDTRTAMMGPALVATTGGALWGDRQLVTGASAFTGTIDTALEGPMGAMLRAFVSSEIGRYVLFSVASKLWLDGVIEEALTWLSQNSVAVGSTVSLGALLPAWSSKAFDDEQAYVEKQWHWLDVTRRVGSGTLKVDAYRSHEQTLGPSQTLDLDLSIPFSTEELGDKIQEARAVRFLLRAQSPAVEVDFELIDLTARYNVTDAR